MAVMHGHGAWECFLEVGESNAAAQALYARAGFLPVGRRKDYYETERGRESAIVMRKAPIGPAG
jgi:ribosomal-protein-alanine N-acetyltransferase